MPEETTTATKPMLTFSKVARKAYLYKNEKKREGTRDPDYKGKLFDLDLNELKEVADENGIVSALHLSGWIEEDQSGTSRLSVALQKSIPQDGEAAATEPAMEPAEAPF